MKYPILELKAAEFPPLLREIPQPPTELWYQGVLPSPDMKLLSVVGSRKYTTYGKQVVDHLLDGLSGYNVGIVSGLALGVDSLAHEAALSARLYTLAIPGSGLDDSVLYPAKHKSLARKILEAGGGMLSEFPSTTEAAPWTFPQRNRIMAGISHATLVIEAAEKSGTLITARLATDYNRELLVVPGNIFSINARGVHQFLKLGATPVTEAADILYALGINPEETPKSPTTIPADITPEERKIIEALREPTDRDTLIRACGLPTREASVQLMQMEMKGLISQTNGIYQRS